MPERTIFTVGHSTKSFSELAALLAKHQIGVLVDVRSAPFSRMAPDFNRPRLEQIAPAAGFTYVFMGEELGGRPSDSSHYDEEGRALYNLMARDEKFTRAMSTLVERSSTYRIALMCSEGKPEGCHRELLVGRVLREWGVEVRHILPDGSIQDSSSTITEPTLFDLGEPEWKSVQSVLRPGVLRTSSQP
jgi:uncharacterized protein (DUF488 family)